MKSRLSPGSWIFVAASVVILASNCAFIDSALAGTWHVPGDASTIQGGVDLAAPGDIVQVAAGTYTDCTHPDPNHGGIFKLNCVIMKPGVTLRGDVNDPGSVIIDAEYLGRVIYCADLAEPATIEGFTIRNGDLGAALQAKPSVPGSLIDTWTGGGLAVVNSTLAVYKCIFENNLGDNGGAVYAGSAGVSFSYCDFYDNNANSFGGAIEGHDVMVEYCHFARNSSNHTGGAISGTGFSVESCLFEDNSASSSGGAASGSDIDLINCSLLNNEADYFGGGAVSGGDYYAFNTDFGGNGTAFGIGPGGLIDAGQTALLVCCIADLANWAGDGTTILDNSVESCGMDPVSATQTSWGSMKSMFR